MHPGCAPCIDHRSMTSGFYFGEKIPATYKMTDHKLVHTRQCFRADKLREALWTLWKSDREREEKDRLYREVHVLNFVNLYEDWERACASFDSTRTMRLPELAKAREHIEEFRRGEQWADVCERCQDLVAHNLKMCQ